MRFVFAATVGRLDEDVVRGRQVGRVADDRRPRSAEVAGADDDPLIAAVLDPQPDDRRAEDVAGVEERRPDTGRDLALLVVVDRAEVLDRPLGILDRVQRQRRDRCRSPAAGSGGPASGSIGGHAGGGSGSTRGLDVLASFGRVPDLRGRSTRRQRPRSRPTRPARRPSRPLPPPSHPRPPDRLPPDTPRPRLGRRPRPGRDGASPIGLALGELLVQMPRIEQHERRQLDGPGRRMDLAAEARLDEHRQSAAVVEMGVCQHDGVEFRRVETERDPVAD